MKGFAGVAVVAREGPILMRREDMLARARRDSDSMPEILEEVECDQRFMFRLGLKVFSGRLLERLLSYRNRLVGGIAESGLRDLVFRRAFRGSASLGAATVIFFLTVGPGDEVEFDRETLLLWATACADVSMSVTDCW